MNGMSPFDKLRANEIRSNVTKSRYYPEKKIVHHQNFIGTDDRAKETNDEKKKN
jgi:hypothetical protein